MSRTRPLPAPEAAAWRVILGLGGLFLVAGGVDLLLLWLPSSIGNPEWEFGTASTFFDRLPLLALGLALALAAGLALGRRHTVLTGAGLCLLLVVVLLGAAFLYLTVLPMALRSAPDPALAIQLKKAALKTAVQSVVFPLLLLRLATLARKGMTGGRALPAPG